MSFHRAGAYAVNFGLDTDNHLKMGGWSAGSIRHTWQNNGNYIATGNVTAFSDITLKENVEPIANAVERVTQINGITYTRNDVEDKEHRYTGVIAQEVESVLPEAVLTGTDGIKSVAYGNMVGLLVEAIKELHTDVKELTNTVTSQQEVIEELRRDD